MNCYKEKFEYIENRFPNAQFVVSCFKTIEEVENKILCEDNSIIVLDFYVVNELDKYTRKWKRTEEYKDYFIVNKKEGQDHIYYKDVIDELIRNNFIRNLGDHRFLESIGLYDHSRNDNSIKVYGLGWGS